MSIECRTCPYFHSLTVENGQCRHNPPSFVVGSFGACFPRVAHTDWCGKHPEHEYAHMIAEEDVDDKALQDEWKSKRIHEAIKEEFRLVISESKVDPAPPVRVPAPQPVTPVANHAPPVGPARVGVPVAGTARPAQSD